MTNDQSGLTRAQLRTPRAAAIAGILFSALLLAVYWLMRLSVPADPHESGAWLKGGVTYVVIALNLVPFAGVAFLWFVGALRDRLLTPWGRALRARHFLFFRRNAAYVSLSRAERATIRNAVSQAMARFRRGLGVGRCRVGAGLARDAVLPEGFRDGGMGVRG